MQIHVIRPGETLSTISRLYSIPLNELININEVPNPNNLVVGQTLVIPIWGSYHWIKSGESLYTISKQYDIPISELKKVNGITNPDTIPVGSRLYIPQKEKTSIDTGAYIDPRITREKSAQYVNDAGKDLTFVNIFSYAVNRDGTLTPVIDQPSINAAYENDAIPLLVLTNFEEGQFSQEIATTIFNDETLQNKVLDEAIRIMEQKGYLGLDFDFEYLGRENREKYNAFLRKASIKLKEKGYFLSSALAPKLSKDQIGVLYEGHDYKAHGEIVDFIFFMTYEWGWSGGPPMAVSPINEVRKVIEYAITEVPRNKIMMGIPLYGYDWTLPYVKGAKWAKAVSPQQAIKLAAKYGAKIEYDEVSQAPYFNYIDEQGKEHVVWFEDARSIQAKFDLVKELGIKGFYYWVLGNDFPQNWLLIEDNFTVKKRT